jgi:hypothetical protein
MENIKKDLVFWIRPSSIHDPKVGHRGMFRSSVPSANFCDGILKWSMITSFLHLSLIVILPLDVM